MKCSCKGCDKSYHVSCGQRQGFIFRSEEGLQAICKPHQSSLSKKQKDSLQRKYADFTKNPEKYSLTLDKSEYQWVRLDNEKFQIGDSKEDKTPKVDEGEFFINLGEEGWVKAKDAGNSPQISFFH